MKKSFITGLILLLPLAVTIAVVVFFFNLLTDPLAGIVSHLFDGRLFVNSQLQYFFSQVLILIFLFFFTVLIGIITRYFFVKYLIELWDYLIHKIPLIRSIYKTSQDVITTLFDSKENSFKQVVLAPFPYPGAYSVGFLTQKNLTEEGKVAVFVPTAPNPTSGFLMLYKESELIFLDMKVEEAFKYVISCGVINTSFKDQG